MATFSLLIVKFISKSIGFRPLLILRGVEKNSRQPEFELKIWQLPEVRAWLKHILARLTPSRIAEKKQITDM